MTWTYGYAPSTASPGGRRDAVRLLVGDNDPNDKQEVQDEEIAFALSQANNNVYTASSFIARSLAGKYSRLVDTTVDGISAKYSTISESYFELARRMDKMATEFSGSTATAGEGLGGVPLAGGIRMSEMEAAEEDTDRVPSAFKTGQFRNPQTYDDDPWRKF